MNRINSRPPFAERAMNVTLWTLQVLWGVSFSITGFGKVFFYNPVLWNRALHQVPWFSAVPQDLMIFIGVCELVGGIGLILPAATGIKPMLTPLAASGLALVMILAAAFHIVRGEYGFLVLNLVLAGVAAYIAYQRAFTRPVAPASVNTLLVLKGSVVLLALLLVDFATLPAGWNK
jgi:uncharacterized membrane protein YphA (DoxX/SURF4 family)